MKGKTVFSALKKEATRQTSLPFAGGRDPTAVESDFDAVCSRARVVSSGFDLEDGSPPVKPVGLAYPSLVSRLKP